MEYIETYAEQAKAILSVPFKSKQHVCAALGISKSTFDTWLLEIPEFEEAITSGFLVGEVKARNFLAKAALIPNAKVDLKTLSSLARDIYGIGANEDEAENTEVVNWRIEIVRPES